MNQSTTSNQNDTVETIEAGPRTRYHRRYVGVALLLCIVIVLVGLESSGRGPSSLLFPKSVYITLDGKHYIVTERQLESTLQSRPEALGNQVSARAQALNQRMSTEVNRVFDEAVERVPDYLDWHYSMRGNFSRAAVWTINKLPWADDSASNLEERIFGGESWDQKMLELDAIAQHEYTQTLSTYTSETARWLAQQLQEFETDQAYQNSSAERKVDADSALKLSPDIFHLEAATLNLSYSIGVAAGSAEIARRAMYRRVAARGAARATSVGAATPCVATGPAAAICAGSVFVVVTAGTEFAMIKAKEHFERDEYEQLLLEEIERLREHALYQLTVKPAEQIKSDHIELARRLENKIRPVDLL